MTVTVSSFIHSDSMSNFSSVFVKFGMQLKIPEKIWKQIWWILLDYVGDWFHDELGKLCLRPEVKVNSHVSIFGAGVLAIMMSFPSLLMLSLHLSVISAASTCVSTVISVDRKMNDIYWNMHDCNTVSLQKSSVHALNVVFVMLFVSAMLFFKPLFCLYFVLFIHGYSNETNYEKVNFQKCRF